MLGKAVVKVRRDQAWRFNGDGENQDRTHEATHNANTIACSAGGRAAAAAGLSWVRCEVRGGLARPDMEANSQQQQAAHNADEPDGLARMAIRSNARIHPWTST